MQEFVLDEFSFLDFSLNPPKQHEETQLFSSILQLWSLDSFWPLKLSFSP